MSQGISRVDSTLRLRCHRALKAHRPSLGSAGTHSRDVAARPIEAGNAGSSDTGHDHVGRGDSGCQRSVVLLPLRQPSPGRRSRDAPRAGTSARVGPGIRPPRLECLLAGEWSDRLDVDRLAHWLPRFLPDLGSESGSGRGRPNLSVGIRLSAAGIAIGSSAARSSSLTGAGGVDSFRVRTSDGTC
jgi:hypothetical protein